MLSFVVYIFTGGWQHGKYILASGIWVNKFISDLLLLYFENMKTLMLTKYCDPQEVFHDLWRLYWL